jgi:hypothetical protein
MVEVCEEAGGDDGIGLCDEEDVLPGEDMAELEAVDEVATLADVL